MGERCGRVAAPPAAAHSARARVSTWSRYARRSRLSAATAGAARSFSTVRAPFATSPRRSSEVGALDQDSPGQASPPSARLPPGVTKHVRFARPGAGVAAAARGATGRAARARPDAPPASAAPADAHGRGPVAAPSAGECRLGRAIAERVDARLPGGPPSMPCPHRTAGAPRQAASAAPRSGSRHCEVAFDRLRRGLERGQ